MFEISFFQKEFLKFYYIKGLIGLDPESGYFYFNHITIFMHINQSLSIVKNSLHNMKVTKGKTQKNPENNQFQLPFSIPKQILISNHQGLNNVQECHYYKQFWLQIRYVLGSALVKFIVAKPRDVTIVMIKWSICNQALK